MSDYSKVTKDKPRKKSIWDDDIDIEKVERLSPEEKNRLFPNDYDRNGNPYGDF